MTFKFENYFIKGGVINYVFFSYNKEVINPVIASYISAHACLFVSDVPFFSAGESRQMNFDRSFGTPSYVIKSEYDLE